LKQIKHPLNLWILNEFNLCKKKTNVSLESYRFDEAAKYVYQFVWNLYCDWYIEFAKPILSSSNKINIQELKNTMTFLQSEILLLLHPFIPFVTEELWSLTNFNKFFKTPLILYNSKISLNLSTLQKSQSKNINLLITLISEIRSLKVTIGISPGSFCNLFLNESSSSFKNLVDQNTDIIKRLARVNEIDFLNNVSSSIVKIVVNDENIKIQFDGDINLEDQKLLQIKKIKDIGDKISISIQKLKNKGFVENAPKNIVDNEREMLSSYKLDLEKINNILRSFK